VIPFDIVLLSERKASPTMKFIFVFLAAMTATAAFAGLPPKVIPLWPEGVPGAKANLGPEKQENGQISNVSEPTLTVYSPAVDKPNGTAVIICPGGGYGRLAIDHEGVEVAKAFNLLGVTAFVLKYRLPDDSINIDRSLAPLQDAQQAICWVRANAAHYGIDRNKIGIMGFSAGGHLASTAATHFNFKADAANIDTTSARPDFAILIYPVITFDSTFGHKGSRNNLVGANASKEKFDFYSNELQVTPATPPIFLIHASDDATVPVENSIRFYQACIKNKVLAEMHIYPKGGHGFGMYNKTTDDSWMERLRNWLNSIK
jgi:acetyl esterase/lipase